MQRVPVSEKRKMIENIHAKGNFKIALYSTRCTYKVSHLN